MAAEGDLRNALAKVKRRRHKEISVENVELEVIGGNYKVEEGDSIPEKDKLLQALSQLFKDPKDMMAVEPLSMRRLSGGGMGKPT